MLTLFFRLISVLCVAWAEAPEAPTHLDYRVDANFSYFSTDSNYAPGGGSSTTLNNNGYFTDMITTGKFTQDLDREMRVYGGFTYSMTESYDGTNTRSNAGFNELMAGGQYWMDILGFPTVPSVDLVYPIVRVDRGSDDALLGEGAIRVRGGSWMRLNRGTWVPFVYLGYEYRDEGRSHAIPYSAGLKWRNNPMWAQLEYRGYERLFANSDTENRTSRDTFLQKVDGGSYRYYSINQAISEAAFEAGYSFGAFAIYAGAAITINGSSTANGYSGIIGAAYTPGVESDKEDEPGHNFSPVDIPDRFTPQVETLDELDPTKPPPKSRSKKARPAPVGPPPPITDDVTAPARPPQKRVRPTQPARPAQPAKPVRTRGRQTKPAIPSPPASSGTQQPMAPPVNQGPPQGTMPDVELRPAPPKANPPTNTKPRKKTKTDKLLDEAEENLKNL
jgi:hypothetical protein